MKRSLLFLFISFSFSGFCQDEVEWFQDGQEWYYNIYCFQEFSCGHTHYEVDGVEFIAGREATVLNRSFYTNEFDGELFSVEYLNYENDTVWRYSSIAEGWHMLYDLGAEVGDVWTIQEDVFYGYSDDGVEPEEIPLFQVVVDSVAFWEEVPNSSLTDRRVVFTRPVDELQMSDYAFGSPIVEGIGAVGGAHGLIGNPSFTLLPLQAPSFQCFLENGELVYGESGSPCFTLGTDDIQQVKGGLIYPNPAYDAIRWDDSFQSLTIYDIAGKVVLQNTQAFNTQSLFVGDLNRGLYTVVVEKENTRFSQKLVIER